MYQILKDPCSRAMGLSVASAVIMLIGKSVAYYLTGSAAIFSDMSESIVHLMTVAMAGFSLWYARVPADKDHPYGHGKIVYLSVATEGFIVLGAGVGILGYALYSFYVGHQLEELDTGMWILGGLAIINYLLARHLISVGTKHNNKVLIGSGKHLIADMWTTTGVFIGVGIVNLTGYLVLDSVVAILVSLNVLKNAFGLLSMAYHGIMERVDEKLHKAIVTELDKSTSKGTIEGYHALRHRCVDKQLWIEVHLVFPPDLTIREVHNKACQIEVAIDRAIPDHFVWITTHLEPEGHEENHPAGHFELLAQG